MTGMTLNELKQTLTDFYETEFFYFVTISKGDKNFVDTPINAKIFPDGKSIVEF